MKDIDKKVEDWKSRPLFKAMNDQQKRTSIGWLTDTLTTIKEAGIKEGERRCEERIRGRLCRICYIWERDHERNPITCKSPNMLHTFEKNATPTNTKEEGDN